MARTVAIERVLRAHDGPVRPIEIWSALRCAGRNDPKMEVQVTTFDLWERGRIGKVGQRSVRRRTGRDEVPAAGGGGLGRVC